MAATDNIVQPNAFECAVGYANSVLSGSIVACKYVRLACQRFLDDLKNGADRGFYFDADAAQHSVDFFGCLKHTKGIWAKKVETAGFLLAPWQVFILANLFGFIVLATGQRRFREAHIEVARKNGKSTFLAGIGLYMLVLDGEPGAEVYSAATTKEQAKIVFNAAKDMVKVSPSLAGRVGAWRNNLHFDLLSSKFEPLASDARNLDGLNIHCALIDELHEHPNRTLYDVLNTATGSRSQPLILAITTAGFDREGICWDQRLYGVKILTNITPDDNFFAFIATLDDGDNWEDEKNWIKANPNLGVSVSLEAIRPNYVKAKEQPAALNEFLRKHLNCWTASDTAWLLDGAWEKNCAEGTEHMDVSKLRTTGIERLKGRRCYAGLDVAEVEDLTAFVLVFPPCIKIEDMVEETETQAEADRRWRVVNGKPAAPRPVPQKRMVKKVLQEKDDKWVIVPFFWIPEAFVHAKEKKNRAKYTDWVRAGLITVTQGNVVDQEAIRSTINWANDTFRVGEVGFDSWGTQWLAPKLVSDGVKMIKVPQNFEAMSNPLKSLTGFLNSVHCEHFNNSVLRWMASNVQLLLDTNGNQKPDKGKSKNKIDGIVAAVMAVGRALANPTSAEEDNPDKYKMEYL